MHSSASSSLSRGRFSAICRAGGLLSHRSAPLVSGFTGVYCFRLLAKGISLPNRESGSAPFPPEAPD